MSRKSSGPQATSERNWRMAAVFLGPRHRMAWSRSCRKESMEMTARFSLYMAGMSSFFSFISMVAFRPSRLGTLGPCMSASRMPTLKPRWARAAAVLTVTELLPTPPLPLMTKILCRMWARRSAMIWSCRAMADSMQPAPPGLPLEEQPDAEEQEEQEDMISPLQGMTTGRLTNHGRPPDPRRRQGPGPRCKAVPDGA